MDNEEEKSIKIITTRDGSHSLLHPGLDETYHSRHGALQESMHVFIKMGWEYWLDKNSPAITPDQEVHLLELGMGTGLNVLLTAEAWLKQKSTNYIKLVYHTVEPYPIPENLVTKLNYCQTLQTPGMNEIFNKIHQSPWNREVLLLENFKLYKWLHTIETFAKETSSTFDIIYYDAFAPNKQNTMWTLDILQETTRLLKPGGILVTYCAKGQFKRDLKSLGLFVETLSGPPGKAEMVRATIPE